HRARPGRLRGLCRDRGRATGAAALRAAGVTARRDRRAARRDAACRGGVMTHVLEFSYMYPSPRNPNSGVFIERQVRELSRMIPLDVVSPVPWAPRVLW